ncbi:hypothetical protein [Polymorphospora sp. NPDC050346]|uniref:hypothetical protein n=1 Tax=Polymorphospora sp. NPDC050346 TaxID=3155780 RepID=UPI0033C0EE96
MTGPEPTADAWRDYLAAAQRLDAVRRAAAQAASEQAQAVQAARDELTGVRARLVPQQSRLRELGVRDRDLVPEPAEVAAEAAGMGGGPGAVVAALRRSRSIVDVADAAAAGTLPDPPRGAGAPWLRNLLVYGPFALVVLVIEVALYLVSGERSPDLAVLLCGAGLPVAAFALGWLVVGFVFRPAPGARVERTALVGALVCGAPMLVLCLWSVADRING